MRVVDSGNGAFSVSEGAPLRLGLWGEDGAPLAVWAGTLERYSLLSAHLAWRYSNRTNPDYHPAGAFLTGWAAPLYVEAFTSDVLGARLLGAEVELEHVLFGKPRQRQRYTLSVSAVREWGRAGGASPALTLAHLDAAAVVRVRADHELHLLAGVGGRPGQGGAWGAVAGVGADWTTPTLLASLRLEARRQLKKVEGTGIRIEWHVAEADAAEAIGKLLKGENLEAIKVVYTPAK